MYEGSITKNLTAESTKSPHQNTRYPKLDTSFIAEF